MATQISGDTGVSQCQPDSIGQDDLKDGLAGTGPAFRAYRATSQTGLTAATWNKVLLTTKDFDVTSAFNTGTSRFQPTVAGYYSVTGRCYITGSGTVWSGIFKNGVLYAYGTSGAQGVGLSLVADLVYLNGTSDYLELHINPSTATSIATADSTLCNFAAHLARKA